MLYIAKPQKALVEVADHSNRLTPKCYPKLLRGDDSRLAPLARTQHSFGILVESEPSEQWPICTPEHSRLRGVVIE
ncbi:hypothetical protein BRAS3809_3510002 [Bradyrhizobium sp. STM 3809]|nr:hypothetical protein BRAS3809_3510002 [Bradyrhizobium sp. STM 3809]